MLTIFETEEHSDSERKHGITQLIVRAQSGDREAFGRLIEILDEDLRRIASRNIYNQRIDPQDVFQDSVMQAMHSIAALRNVTCGGFLSWFSGIARNRVLTLKSGATRGGTPNKKTPYPWLRMEPYGPEQLEMAALEAPDVLAEEGVCPIEPVLSELSPITRVGWLMREVFGMDWDSVALVLHKGSRAAARQTHYRACLQVDPLGPESARTVTAGVDHVGSDR